MSGAEQVKARSRRLRGTLSEELLENTPVFSDDAGVVLKFHGVYQQDDRDLRKEARRLGGDKHHMMMIRTRIPGGIVSPDAYLAHDRIAGEWGNATLRVTTRQDLQLHGVLKGELKRSIRAINDTLLTTLGGCGDQERNIMCCPAPWNDRLHTEIHRTLVALVTGLTPTTRAYSEIWLDGDLAASNRTRSTGHALWRALPASQVQDRHRYRGRQLHRRLRQRSRLGGACDGSRHAGRVRSPRRWRHGPDREQAEHMAGRGATAGVRERRERCRGCASRRCGATRLWRPDGAPSCTLEVPDPRPRHRLVPRRGAVTPAVRA